MRSISDKQSLALKAATRRALDLAGGGDNFQHVTRIKAGNLSKYGSPNDDNADKFMPIDVAVEADQEAGAPIILTAMAEMIGYRVVAATGPQAVAPLPVTIKDALKIVHDAADVARALSAALENDHIDQAEQREITREADELSAALSCLVRRVRGQL